VSNHALRVLLLIGIMLWCIALMAGAAVVGFIGMMFAGEPGSGAEVTGSEYLILGTPMLLSILLTIGLITLWAKQYYKAALVAWLASFVLAGVIYAYVAHGFII
jgi:hypothetical protein